MNSRRIHSFAGLCAVMVLLSGYSAQADDKGAYSGFTPYSVYGVGDMFTGGSAYNMTMGGVGIASRNNRYLNSLNPAAVTARDTLSFMSDLSLYQHNRIFRQGDQRSVSNLFNINDFIISFPVFPKTAMMIGIKPYSSTGYNFNYYETNPGVIGTVGNMSHKYYGQGSMYQLFVAGGITLWNSLSLGAEYIHYTGNLEKTYEQELSDAAAIGVNNTTEMILSGNTAKLGLQYSQKFNNSLTMCFGATYKFNARLGGFINNTVTSGSATISTKSDTLSRSGSRYYLSDEMGFGVSLQYGRKFRAEIDYTRSDWKNCGFVDPIFTPGIGESVRLGVEYIPRPNDVRYYRNIIAYRAGTYFTKEYYSVNGSPIYSRGVTLGVTLPVFQWYNGISLGVDIGQRGSLSNSLIRETYFNFSLGINLFDIWFQQYRYE